MKHCVTLHEQQQHQQVILIHMYGNVTQTLDVRYLTGGSHEVHIIYLGARYVIGYHEMVGLF